MSKLLINIILFVLPASSIITAQNIQEQFKQANQHYKNKEFDTSISIYEKILSQDYEGAEIYYNLGNAYFKNENLAAAILNYERAKKLNPADEDILFNLQFANLKVIDKIEPIPQLFYKKWWNNILSSNSFDGWARSSLIFLWMALVGTFIFLFARKIITRKMAFFISLIAFFFTVIFSIFAYQQYKFHIEETYAIVFESSAYIKSAPEESSIDLFILHEGVKVEVTDRLEGWKKIRLADGKTGWISEQYVVLI